MSTLKAAWRGFRVVMERVGNFQARVLLTVFYLVPAAPFGVGSRFFSDRLRLRHPVGWIVREPQDQTLDAARRQF